VRDGGVVVAAGVPTTKNGAPAAVLIGVDEWGLSQETLHWLSQPGTVESVAESRSTWPLAKRMAKTRFAPRSRVCGACPEVVLEDGYATRFAATARPDLDKLPQILAADIGFVSGYLAADTAAGWQAAGRRAGRSARCPARPYRLVYRIDDATGTIWVHRVDHCAEGYRRP
jgi:hypothetical protein